MNQLLRYIGKDIQPIDFEPWLEQKPEELRPIAMKWFDCIKNCGADVCEIFHDNYPIGCVDDAPFAYVNVFTRHVNVGFFYGVDLPDESGLMEGTGKRMRHVKLRLDTVVNEEELQVIIKHSYVDIKQRLLLDDSFR